LRPNARPGAAHKAPPWRREKKNAPRRALLPQITPETAKSPRERAPTSSSPWGLLAALSHDGANPPDGPQDIAAA
jgi:hypothetical protein